VAATNSPESLPEAAPAAVGRDRKRPPRWIVLGLLGLFACWFVAMQWRQRAGEPVHWAHDFAQAEQHAREADRLIFLMLQAPNCPIAAALDRDLFSQLDVRKKMAMFVCCRLEVRPTDPVGLTYGFTREPIMVVLRPGSQRPLMHKLEGKIQELELNTVLVETLKSQAKEP
jgi:hypothetical protein